MAGLEFMVADKKSKSEIGGILEMMKKVITAICSMVKRMCMQLHYALSNYFLFSDFPNFQKKQQNHAVEDDPTSAEILDSELEEIKVYNAKAPLFNGVGTVV